MALMVSTRFDDEEEDEEDVKSGDETEWDPLTPPTPTPLDEVMSLDCELEWKEDPRFFATLRGDRSC